MQLNLLEKTELRVYGVAMQTVNLCGVAAAAAAVLELPFDKVIVVDVREDHICLDLLVQNIDIRQVVGREKALLAALAAVEGLTLADGAYVDSAGIMGLIACDGDDTAESSSPAPSGLAARWSAACCGGRLSTPPASRSRAA